MRAKRWHWEQLRTSLTGWSALAQCTACAWERKQTDIESTALSYVCRQWHDLWRAHACEAPAK